MQTKPLSSAQNGILNFAALLGGAQVQFQSTTKAVTPFAGLASFFAWLRQIGLPAQLALVMPFTYSSPNAIPPVHTFLAFLASVIVGASRFAHSGWLRSGTAVQGPFSPSAHR